MNRQEIEKVLQYRDPCLMLDEVIIEEEGKRAKGKKTLTGEEYFFEGHFPGLPVMPGVLIVEAIAQTSIVATGNGKMRICGVENIKFRKPIEPGNSIEISVELEDESDGISKFSGTVVVEGDLAASGKILLK